MREKERGEGAQDVRPGAQGNVCSALVSLPPRRCHDVATYGTCHGGLIAGQSRQAASEANHRATGCLMPQSKRAVRSWHTQE
jgi:hypothetical protein